MILPSELRVHRLDDILADPMRAPTGAVTADASEDIADGVVTVYWGTTPGGAPHLPPVEYTSTEPIDGLLLTCTVADILEDPKRPTP